MKNIKLTTLCFSFVFLSILSFAQIPFLVKDINNGTAWSSPRRLTKVGQTLYFEAITNLGWGLYKSDGTAAGTVMLKNFGPNNEIYDLTDINGVLYFRVNDGINGFEPWISDGTAAGTVMLKDINPGSLHSYAGGFFYYNNKILFSATDNVTGPAIWTTDGTAAGTSVFKDLDPGNIQLGGVSENMVVLNNTLYFWGNRTSSPATTQLWKSDGTVAGTEFVKTMEGVVTHLVVSSNKLFFGYGGGPTGLMGFWVSDGSAAGTELLVAQNIALGMGVLDFELLDVNGTTFFRGNDPTTGKELWKSDGTVAGTQLVKNIMQGGISSGPGQFVSFLGKCYFVCTTDSAETEMWKSDGTDAGTVQIEPTYSGCTHPNLHVVNNNTLYFSASPWTGNTGTELWKSDGTTNTMVYDINTGAPSYSGNNHTIVNNKMFFQAEEPIAGVELWALDVSASPNHVLDQNFKENYKLYPNPIGDRIYIEVHEQVYKSYQILDLNGKIIIEGKVTNASIDAHGLKNGIYVVNLLDSNGNKSSNVVIK